MSDTKPDYMIIHIPFPPPPRELSEEEVRAALAPFIGRPNTLETQVEMLKALQRARGYDP